MISPDRRKLLGLGGWGALSCAAHAAGSPGPLAAGTAARRKVRIFMVLGRGEGDNEKGFKDYLQRQGLDVEYTIRNTAGDASKLPAIVEEIKTARPDLIYSWGTPQTRAIVGAHDDPNPAAFIRDIPVVFTFVADPVDAKIVRSLDKRSGNVTGTIHIAPVSAQVNTILSYRKGVKLGVIYNPAERNSVLALEALRKEWKRQGLTLIESPAPLVNGKPDPANIPAMIERCKSLGADMLYLGPDTFIAGANRKIVSDTALALRLPTFSVTELIVRSERALFSLSSSSYGIGRFTGLKAAQILVEGQAPGQIPVETLRRFSVVINMATARTLSYYPPIGLLNFAEVVGA